MLSTSLVPLLLAGASLASAKTIDINVGENNQYAFSPSSITAAKGDTLVFHFYAGGHDVTQGTFNSACQSNGGFFSGFINPTSGSGPADNVFVVTVNSTDPVYYL
jgi:plastocyanin